ncbi:hypothetical protein GHT06_010795 [Daphnia sinensis]|uniref:Homeobox domain-containing protein n=1 Tax=Daphnia sinensis TaxID=1820382 RepID=A0AAD5L156_9CRUS|nr:hypothetical protein GHT06_010795 [Daphnia sinensis]
MTNNGNKERRSLQKRLSFEIVNWLKKLYAINPYPDRFQYGTMALHCKVDAARVQNWFVSRRASDWRRGRLCRRCRYFKSPLATEELHQLNPNSRHCVLLTMPQYLQNVANQTGVTLACSTPPSTTDELDVVNNEKERTQLFSSPAPSFTQPLEHQPHIYRQQTQYSQSAIPYQMYGQQLGGMMPHQLPYSSQMRQNFHQMNGRVPLTSIQGANVGNNECFSDSSFDQKSSSQTYWSSSQNSLIVSRSWMPIAVPSAPKLENDEFVQDNPILNAEVSGEDYSQIVYPDYMDFPHFPLPTNNVSLKPF